MLDDLNKLVPKLDEDDKERMFNNIKNIEELLYFIIMII